jgi:hypothetical protein
MKAEQANNYPIILIAYVGVFDMVRGEDYEYLMEHVNKMMRNTLTGRNDVIYFVIPVRENNKIDIKCINPLLVSPEDYSRTLSTLEDVKEASRKFLDSLKK